MRRGVGRDSTSSEVSRNLRRANRRGLNGARKGNPGVLVSTPELTRLDQGNDQIDRDTSETHRFGLSSGYLMSCFGMLDSVHIGSPLLAKEKTLVKRCITVTLFLLFTGLAQCSVSSSVRFAAKPGGPDHMLAADFRPKQETEAPAQP
jgi:hypothetical protein